MTRRIITAALAAAGLLLAGCTSAPGIPQSTASPGTGASGSAAARPVGPPGVQASGTLRLGLQENLADAAPLLGWQLGFYGQHLGQVTFEPMPYTSAAGEATALENGQLDAAYLDPVTALQASQFARGGTVKIIAGAANGPAALAVAQTGGHPLALPAGQYPAAVLVATQRFLTANPSAVTALLNGQLETDYYLARNRISAKAALAQKLAAIGEPLPPAALARAFAQYAYTEDPLPAALATEARRAAAARLIKLVTKPAAIYDLGLLNQALKTAGRPTIGV